MSHRIPKLGAVLVLGSIGLTVAGVLLLNALFGGPKVLVSAAPSYQLTTFVPNAESLLERSLVLVRGVQVGYVSSVSIDGDQAKVTIAVNPSSVSVYRNATIEIGHRSLFGEAYIRLDPGTRTAGPLPNHSTLGSDHVIGTIDFDQALSTLNAPTRTALSSLVHTGALIERQPESSRALNDTVGGLAATLAQLPVLTGLLTDQQSQLSSLVSSTTAVTSDLGTRDREIAMLVGSARVVSEALAAEDVPLGRGIADAATLLSVGRSTLTQLQPLVSAAGPLVSDLDVAAPPLTTALQRLPAAAHSLADVITGLPTFTRAAAPMLRRLRGASHDLRPLAVALEPALRDLIPMLAYAAPHAELFVGFLDAGADSIRHLSPQGTDAYVTPRWVEQQKPINTDGQDGLEAYAPFFIGNVNTGLTLADSSSVKTNPYPSTGKPGIAWSGKYPELQPAPPPK